jgi:glycosyltransferase involved in cell wall biosynthesis
MRVAFVVPYVPNLIRARPYNLIRALCRRGHALTVYTQFAGPAEQADAVALSEMGVRVVAWPAPRWRPPWNSLCALTTRAPLQVAYAWLPELAQALNIAVAQEQMDVVHVEHLRGARYALGVKAARPEVPIVWDSVDCISHLFEQAAAYGRSARWRVMTRLELPRTRRFEALMRDRMDRTLVTSEVDRQALEALPAADMARSPRRHFPVTVVPNGVDFDYFQPGQVKREPDTLVFSGKMSYHANSTAALYLILEIMPLVWQNRPEARLWIVGKDPTPELRAAAAREADRITVTGSVPDIRPYLQSAALAIAPIVYGAGIQNKVLEAMASQTPVIVARRAIAALSAVPGQDLLAFDHAAEAAEQVVSVLSQPALAARLGAAGCRYVERHHRWDSIASLVEGAYGESIAGVG